MNFDWDDANRDHIAAHNVSTEEAEQVIQNNPIDLEIQDDPADIFRHPQIGETNAGRILVVLSTLRGSNIRVISAWDASRSYKNFYHSERARQAWHR